MDNQRKGEDLLQVNQYNSKKKEKKMILELLMKTGMFIEV